MSEENQNVSAGETSSPYSNTVPTANLGEQTVTSPRPVAMNVVDTKSESTSPLAVTLDFVCAAVAIAFTVLFFIQQ